MYLTFKKLFGWVILVAGLVGFLLTLTMNDFISGIILAFTTIIAWLVYTFLVEKADDFITVGFIMAAFGFVVGLAILFNYGIEPLAYPKGGFVINPGGIAKALGVFVFFLTPALMFYYYHKHIVKTGSDPTADLVINPDPQVFVDSEEWEVLPFEEFESDQFEKVK